MTGTEDQVPPVPPPEESEGLSPARELTLHVLRMIETRVDAASIALQGETQLLLARLQLKLLAAAALFIAIWGGIVLLAIALPPDLRVPVLALVVGAFVAAAVIAQSLALKKASTREVGSLHWFLDSLRQDLEVLSRALGRAPPRSPPMTNPPADNPPPERPPGSPPDRNTANDLAA